MLFEKDSTSVSPVDVIKHNSSDKTDRSIERCSSVLLLQRACRWTRKRLKPDPDQVNRRKQIRMNNLLAVRIHWTKLFIRVRPRSFVWSGPSFICAELTIPRFRVHPYLHTRLLHEASYNFLSFPFFFSFPFKKSLFGSQIAPSVE